MIHWQIAAARDPRLSVELAWLRTLHYTTAGSDGRPAHVRAASGLAHVDDRWYVVQDDAAFVAVVAADEVSAIPLAVRGDGQRVFSSAQGNKLDKPDVEACFVAQLGAAPHLFGFGSGTLANRCDIAVVNLRTTHAGWIDGTALYQQIAGQLGHPPNIEAATLLGHTLWLFHRGNTGSCDVGCVAFGWRWADIVEWLGRGTAPAMVARCDIDLGHVDGVRLGVTDAAVTVDGTIFILAAAEASADAIGDGAVVGQVIGVIDCNSSGEWAGVRMTTLPPSIAGANAQHCKPEGLVVDSRNGLHACIVCDPDQTDVPATLAGAALRGPWQT